MEDLAWDASFFGLDLENSHRNGVARHGHPMERLTVGRAGPLEPKRLDGGASCLSVDVTMNIAQVVLWFLRQFQSEDLSVLYAISLETGHLGGDASHLYGDPRLIGHIYSAPYALLDPDLVLVAADDRRASSLFDARLCLASGAQPENRCR